jgi:transcriptional regulator with XRE-family HTH domain
MLHPGTALRAIRKSRGLRLEDLVEKLGGNTGGYSRKERGAEDIPTQLLAAWCEVLGVRPSEVFSIAENRPDGLTDDLARLASHMAKLDDIEREGLINQAEFMASRKKRAI